MKNEPIIVGEDVQFKKISAESMEQTKATMTDANSVPSSNSNGGKERKGAYGQSTGRPLETSDYIWGGSSESQCVDEMIHETEKRLKSESQSLEGLFQQANQNLKIAESNSQQSSSSDASGPNNNIIGVI